MNIPRVREVTWDAALPVVQAEGDGTTPAVRAGIKAALRKHEKKIVGDQRMRVIVDRIISVATARAASGGRATSYRPSARRTAQKELDDTAKLAEKLIEKIKGWHKPPIVALANRGVMRHQIEPLLEAFARACRNADVSSVPEMVDTHRPAHTQQNLVATLVIEAYEELTEHDTIRPGRSHGLVALGREIFRLTKLQGDAKAAIQAAQEQRRRRKASQLPPPKKRASRITELLG